jgi:class 3 adenylate cyclase
MMESLLQRIDEVWESAMHAPLENAAAIDALVEEARAGGRPLDIALALRNRMYQLSLRGDARSMLEIGIEADRLIRETDDALGQATISYMRAFGYLEVGALDDAFRHAQRALEAAELSGNMRWQSWAHHIIGSFYRLTGDATRAGAEFYEALAQFEQIGHTIGIVRVLWELATMSRDEHDLERAGDFHRRIEETADVPGPLKYMNRVSFAAVLVELGELKAADELLTQARAFHDEFGEGINTPKLFSSIGLVERARGNGAEAIDAFHTAIRHARESGQTFDHLALCRELSNTYESQGDLKEALDYAREYQSVREQLFDTERSREIKNMEIQHAISRAEAEAELERRKNAEIEALLMNILPEPVARELQSEGSADPVYYERATILFVDFVGFTGRSASVSPEALVSQLHEAFCRFDEVIDAHGLEKLKTIGDAYMAVGGVPVARPDHAQIAVRAALAMREAMTAPLASDPNGTPWRIRVGLNSGPVVAGVVGRRKFAYDIWGDAVNVASRMESISAPDAITVSQATAELVEGEYRLASLGQADVKGLGPREVFEVLGPRDGRDAGKKGIH